MGWAEISKKDGSYTYFTRTDTITDKRINELRDFHENEGFGPTINDELCANSNWEECPLNEYRLRGQWGSNRYFCAFESCNPKQIREMHRIMQEYKERKLQDAFRMFFDIMEFNEITTYQLSKPNRIKE